MDKKEINKPKLTRLSIKRVAYKGELAAPKGELNFIYYLSGEHTVNINGATKKLSDDDLSSSAISDKQSYYSDKGEVIILECDNIFLLQFKAIYQEQSFNSFMRKKSENRRILAKMENLLKIDSESDEILSLSDFDSMTPLMAINLYMRGNEHRDEEDIILLQTAYVNNILYDIKDIYGFYYNAPDILERLRKYIDDNFTNNLSRDGVARRFGYNPCYFSVFFKKHFGMNFLDYINRLRYELVQQRLSFNPNSESKTNIILSSGFNNTLSYYRYAKTVDSKNAEL